MAATSSSAAPFLFFSSSLSLPSSGRRLLPLLVCRSSPPLCRRILAVRAKIREIFMPALSSTMTEGKIVSWVKAEGDHLSKGESVIVVESDKADMDVETFYDGILTAIVVLEDEIAPIGTPISLLAESEDEVPLAKAQSQSQSQGQSTSPPSPPPPPPPSDPAPSPAPTAAAKAVAEGPRKAVAMPYAKKLAKQHRVDIEKVVGTGPYGRITSADLITV